jgi:hypothetical protein
MQEQWRTVAGFPDYSVSDHGRVRRDVGGRGAVAGRILAKKVGSHGYCSVNLQRGGKANFTYVHRMVALTFLGPPPTEKHEVAHFDGCPRKNHVSNLRWATPAENSRDRARHGRDPVGDRNGRAKLTECDVRAIRAEYATGLGTQAQIGARRGVDRSTAGKIVRRETWAHLPD